MAAAAEQPTGADLAEWLRVDPATAGLEEAMTAALAAQAAQCITEPYEEPLRIAALHRAAREWHSRALPLGFMDAGELAGVARVGRDWLIPELEQDFLRGSFDKAPADAVSPSGFLPLSGGTMQGPLHLAADPLEPTEAASKAYVDALQFLAGINIEAMEYRISSDPYRNGYISVEPFTDPAAATAVVVHKRDRDNFDRTEYWQRVAAGHWLNIHDRTDSTQAWRYDVTGPAVAEGDTFRIPVTLYELAGSLAEGSRVLAVWRSA